MKTISAAIELDTEGFCDIINITDELKARLADTGFETGVVTVICPGSTGALSTCEYEPGLIKDIKEFFEELIPRDKKCHHDETWQDANGFSHLRATLLGPSISIPFNKGQFVLGTWQQVIFIDFDNQSRHRKLHLQFIGK